MGEHRGGDREHHLVEQRWQDPMPRPRRVRAAQATAVLSVVGLAGAVTVAESHRVRQVTEHAAQPAEVLAATHPGARAVYAGAEVPDGVRYLPDDSVPRSGALEEDRIRAEFAPPPQTDPLVADTGCVVAPLPRTTCGWNLRSGIEAPTTVALVGGSHIAHLRAPITAGVGEVAEVRTYYRSSCPFGREAGPIVGVPEDQARGCDEWNDAVLADLLADPPDLVVTTASRADLDADPLEWVPQEYVDGWQELAAADIPVAAIRIAPSVRSEAWACLSGTSEAGADCAAPTTEVIADDPFADVPLPDNVTVIDTTPLWCPDGSCPAVIGNLWVYQDAWHLSPEFNRTLDEFLGPLLQDRLAVS